MAKIQVNRVLKANLPVLSEGEFGLCTDTDELFIGSQDGNLQIGTIYDIGILSDHIDHTNKAEGKFLEVDANGTLIYVDKPTVTSTAIPASLSTYMLELDKWNVKNDGTAAENTSSGINDALVWASEQGYVELVLPQGTYLIDENNPIEPQSFMTFNLGGSTLRIRDNGLTRYTIINLQRNQRFSRITNGKIEGDRDTHDYTTISHTHEWGFGISVDNIPVEGSNVRFISIDNLEIFNCTGDGIALESVFGAISGHNFDGTFEQGGISSTDGSFTTDLNSIRSSVHVNLHQTNIAKWKYFGLYGDSYGGLGSGITSNLYNLIFYRADDSFHSAKSQIHFFDEVDVPDGVSYAKVVISQSTVPSPGTVSIMLKVVEFPKHVYIEKCNIHHCRRLGISVSGAKHVYIRDCEIHHIKGTAPQGAIDIEDMYDFNQYIYIDGNNIYDNQSYNIIAIAGKHISITNNRLASGIFTINSSVERAIVSNNYFLHSDPRLQGNVIFSDNHLYASRTLVPDSTKQVLIENCYFHNSPLNIAKDVPFTLTVNNCKFFNDLDLYQALGNLSSPLAFSIEPQTISNCTIEGYGREALTVVATGAHDWKLNNVTFINTRHQGNRITVLPPGTYTGCNFINPGRLSIGTDPKAKFDFNGCSFEWDSYDLFYLGTNTRVEIFQVQNSTFTGGKGHNKAFFFWNIVGKIELINNLFDFPNSEVNTAMIDFWASSFAAKSVLVDGNRFTSNRSIIALNAQEISPSITFIFKNNLVETTVVKLGDTHYKLNNYIDGVLDPYFRKASMPTSGFYTLGQQIKNSNPSPGGYMGWVCTKAGVVENTPWMTGNQYSKDSLVNSNNNVYKCVTSGGGTSGTTPPTHTSGTASDGTLDWEYIDTLAEFKTFGLISE